MSKHAKDRRATGVLLVLAAAIVVATVPRLGPGSVALLFLLLLVVHMCHPAGERQVDEFATRSGLTTSRTSRRFIAHHLTTARRLRVVTVIAAIVLPNLVSAALGASGDRFAVVSTNVLWAYLAGTLWAELSMTRPAGATRTASLVPRDPAAYLGRPLRWGLGAAALLATIVWTGVTWLSGGAGSSRASGADVVASIAFAVVVPLVVTGAQRWILRRPQPLVAPELVAADDAVRAAAVRNLAAVGCAMVLIDLAGGLLQYVEVVDAAAVDWLFGPAAAASLALALVSWWSRAWWRPVQRQPFAAVQAPA